MKMTYKLLAIAFWIPAVLAMPALARAAEEPADRPSAEEQRADDPLDRAIEALNDAGVPEELRRRVERELRDAQAQAGREVRPQRRREATADRPQRRREREEAWDRVQRLQRELEQARRQAERVERQSRRMPPGWGGPRAEHQTPRFMIGVMLREDDDDRLVIEEVTVDSPADVAGVRPGDVVDQVDGQPVEEPGDVSQRVQRAGREHREVELVVTRNDQQLQITIEPRQMAATGPAGRHGRSPAPWPFPGGMWPGGTDGLAQLPWQRDIQRLEQQLEELARQVDQLWQQLEQDRDEEADGPIDL